MGKWSVNVPFSLANYYQRVTPFYWHLKKPGFLTKGTTLGAWAKPPCWVRMPSLARLQHDVPMRGVLDDDSRMIVMTRIMIIILYLYYNDVYIYRTMALPAMIDSFLTAFKTRTAWILERVAETPGRLLATARRPSQYVPVVTHLVSQKQGSWNVAFKDKPFVLGIKIYSIWFMVIHLTEILAMGM